LHHSHHRNRVAISENRRRNSSEPQRNWVSPDDVPPDTLDYISAAIDNPGQGRHFCEHGWNPGVRVNALPERSAVSGNSRRRAEVGSLQRFGERRFADKKGGLVARFERYSAIGPE